MKLSDPVYKKLVVFNTVAIVAFLLGGVVLGILGKNIITEKLGNLFDKEVSESVLSSLSKAPDDSIQVDIPVYDIKIKPQTMRQIEAQIKELSATGMMSDDLKIWHPARFFHDGEEYKIKLRLRGDRPWHWQDAKKSWRMKFQKERFFQGRRYIDIIIPKDKYYEAEHVAYQAARDLGLLVPDSGFCRVRVNGVDFGLYLWMEKYGKEMLEKQGYPDGEIFRDRNVWTQTRLTGFGIRPDYYTASYEGTIHQEDDSLGYYAQRWDRLIDLIRNADDETFRREIPHILEVDKYLKWNALTWFYGSTHSHWGDNLRWFYDNTSGLFQPILYDVSVHSLRIDTGNADDQPQWRFESVEHDRLARRVMAIPEYRQKRNEVLWRLVTEDKFDARVLADRFHQHIRPGLLSGAGAESAQQLDRRHAKDQKVLEDNRRDLRAHLEFARLFVAPEVGFHAGKTPMMLLKMLSDSRADILVERLEFTLDPSVRFDRDTVRVVLIDLQGRERVLDDVLLSRDDDGSAAATFRDLALWTPVDARLAQYADEWSLRLELSGVPPGGWSRPGMVRQIRVQARNSISQEPVSDLLTMISPLAYRFEDTSVSPMTRSVEEFVADSGLPFSDEGDSLTLPRGRHRIDRDLTLPFGHGLRLRSGTTLEMAPGVNLVTYGPLSVEGTAQQPVRVVPQSESEPWGVLAVIRADAPSHVRHLELNGGSETHINGVYVSGQLSFYWSEAHIEHSRIFGARADDGLNIKSAPFSIRHSVLHDNMADAFDGDWVEGTIASSIFRDNGGDGVDFSGASVTVHDSILERMGDKAISVGENSDVLAFNNVIRDSETGIASKDLSDVQLYACVLYRNRTGVALYQKKQIFGGATGRSTGSLFWGNDRNVTTDASSTFEAIATGADRWPESDPSITVTGLLQGDPAKHYTINGEGSILHTRLDVESSPFRIETATEELTSGGVTVPDLSGSPAGLLRPLALEPALTGSYRGGGRE